MEAKREEMVGVLTAMSIVAKRLARQLMNLEEGEKEDEQSEDELGFKEVGYRG